MAQVTGEDDEQSENDHQFKLPQLVNSPKKTEALKMAAKNFDGESAMKIQDQSANNIRIESSNVASEIKEPVSVTPAHAPATNNHTVSSIRCASELDNNMTFEKVKTMLVETESAEAKPLQAEENQKPSSQNDSVDIINQELER